MRALSLLPLLIASSIYADNLLRVGSSLHDPHAYRDARGRPTGFFVDVLTEAGRRSGHTVEWVFKEMSLEKAIDSKDIDLYAGGFANPERRARYYFSAPWWREDYYIVVRESSSIRRSSDLANHSLLYELRPPLPAPIAKLMPGSRPIERSVRADRLKAICRGEADAALFNHTSLANFIRARPQDCAGVSLRIVPQNEIDMGLSIASLPAKQATVETLRAAIAGMALDGTMATLSQRYGMFPIQSDELASIRTNWAAIAAALIAFAALFYSWAALRSANRRAGATDVFLATIGHEIRTPMNSVLGYLDLLQDTPLRSDQQQFARDIGRSTSSLLSLLSDIMEFSKLRSGASRLHPRKCDIVAVFEDVAMSGALSAEGKNLEFIVSIDPRVPRYSIADGNRLRQVVSNIVMNAVKFTHAGYVRMDVVYEQAGVLNISIGDTGIGIPEQRRKLIFEPFQQLDSSDRRRYGGIGLGLSVVREVLKLMRGSIVVESKPGFGTRFDIRIPLSLAESAAPWIDALKPPSPELICLIAAESGNLAVLRGYLSSSGYQTIHFADEARAREELTGQSPLRWVILEAGAMSDPEEFPAWLRARAPLVLAGTITATRLISQRIRDRFDSMLTWPVTPGSLTAILQPVEIPPPPRAAAPSRCTVLVVDDNPINRKVAAALLAKIGCTVETAEDGVGAVEMCRRFSYALVLMDCQMPNMDGFEAARRIRSLARHGEKVYIYGTSAGAGEETPKRCIEAGMDGYVPKPIGIQTLEGLLSLALVPRHHQDN